MHGSDPRAFEVSELSPLKVLWLLLPMLAGILLTLLLPATDAGTTWAGVSWTSPQGYARWSVLVLVVMGVGFGWAFFRRRITFDGNVLEVRSTLFRRRVPVAQLLLDQAEVVDLKQHPRLALKHRSFGYSAPGFHSGHYRLRDGRKGFLLVTDVHHALALPVRDGSVLLLSLVEPQTLLATLRKAAAVSERGLREAGPAR